MTPNTELALHRMSYSDLNSVIEFCKTRIDMNSPGDLFIKDLAILHQMAVHEFELRLYDIFQHDPIFQS